MDMNEEYLREDVEATLGDVRILRHEISAFAEQKLESIGPALRDIQETGMAEHLATFHAKAMRLLDRIERLLAEIRSGESGKSRNIAAFSLSTRASQLKAELDWLKDILEYIESTLQDDAKAFPGWVKTQIAAPVQEALQKLKLYLIPLLKNFLSQAWKVISGLLTPREWKLKGEAGSGILGLVNVGVEITFGP